ncbi:MAG: RidA family protein [Alphaproteobacteria bacterium]|nr:RidA family protein [Alphaproteobacteria bacterium]
MSAALAALLPAGWPRPRGFSHGMAGVGRFVLIAGQIGWDTEGRLAEGFVVQTAQALRNILAVLAEAGGRPEHLARLTWYVTDLALYRAATGALGPVWRELMGSHYPAMAVVGVTGLVEPGALVEIEAIAIVP